MALSATDLQVVVSYFCNNAYVLPNAIARVATDTLTANAQQIDASFTTSPTATNATFSLSCTISGTFTIKQAELLAAAVLLRRVGAI